MLAEPVKLNQNGISITVEQAVLDAEHTVVSFQVENLIPPEKPGEDGCSQLPSLRLPDGTEMEGTGSGSGWSLGYNRRLTYPAIPAGVNDATLAFPCLQQTAMSAFPESWEIPLHFVVAPPDQTVYPVVDLPTPTAAPAAENNATANTAPASQEPEGKLLTPVDISLSFDQPGPHGRRH